MISGETASMEENIECAGFTFYNNFDSANLAKVEKVEISKGENGKNENNRTHRKSSATESPSHEFNIWTKPDCHGTEFQNNNRTWFYFGIKAATPNSYIKLNIMNLNKLVKMFTQGMSPVFKVIPGHPYWERIREKPTFTTDDKNNEFILSFNYRASENSSAITYFAFTYPFSYTDLQNYLKKIDNRMLKNDKKVHLADDIYYHRECAIKSLQGRRLDILTISSHHNIRREKEAKIKDLFPEADEERPFKFHDKKVIFLSARVHPGETPSTFVFNGFLNLLLNRDDQVAMTLRRLYIFKLIPMLNPDGVAQGYYRMDTKGVNLNRLYLNPSKSDHPTIYAAKTLLRYYHHSYHIVDDQALEVFNMSGNVQALDSSSDSPVHIGTVNFSPKIPDFVSKETTNLLQKVNLMSIEEKNRCIEQGNRARSCLAQTSDQAMMNADDHPRSIESLENVGDKRVIYSKRRNQLDPKESGIFLYIDLHGHASKKGIFMYGNHFEDPDLSASCMLLPKLMSLNNPNFHFTSCNFAEKNMYLVDKRDGLSREGSGRVAVYKHFGLIHSYTLECNYNTGRMVNSIPARVREGIQKIRGPIFVPPKYSPSVFEEVGVALGPSILDMTDENPNSRLPNSQYRSLKGLKSYLKLISANHYQTSLNRPPNKSGDMSSYSDDSTSDDNAGNATVKSSLKIKKKSMESIRGSHSTANSLSIQKLRSHKKFRQILIRNLKNFPAPKKKKSKESSDVSSESTSKTMHGTDNSSSSVKFNQPVPKSKQLNKSRSQISNKVKKPGKKVRLKLSDSDLAEKSVARMKKTAKSLRLEKMKSRASSQPRTKVSARDDNDSLEAKKMVKTKISCDKKRKMKK